jgi:hypothetical protein
MNAEQFVYWLNGYLELSGAQELSAAQVKSVREHLALVLHKVTLPLEKPTYFGGVKCGVCRRWCSNEGGVCNKCMLSTTTSGPVNRIDPFSTPEPAGLCDGCGKECPHSELNTVISSNLAGVVLCPECGPKKAPDILSAPIANVLCALTC